MLTKHSFAAVLGAFSVSVAASFTFGQGMQAPPGLTPVVAYVTPVAGQAGSTFELRVTGQNINDVEGLHFNFPGVKVEVLGSTTEKGGVDKKGKGLPNVPAQKFKVTLPANAPIGIHDVRIVTKAGVSNPRAFVISNQKEFVEEEPNNDVPTAQKIELNSSVSGVILAPTDVDFYSFTGKKGNRVLCSCLTTSIDSRLPVEMQLYGADGGYLGSNRGYNNSDALLDAVLPSDGEYFVRVYSFSYTQGGTDHFYHLSVSTAPWIDAVFPPIVEPGKATQVTVYGRNLKGGKLDPDAVINNRPLEKITVTIKPPTDARALQRLASTGFISPVNSMLDGFEHREENASGMSNAHLLSYAAAPIVVENADNDDKDKAQKIAVPCVIAGRIEKKADRDWYTFSAKKGQVFHIETFGERVGAPMDLYFQLRDQQGSLITEQDDTAEILSPQFYTRSDDPSKYRFVVPADGTYYLVVTSRDAFIQYGPRNLYTVHITTEQPDFRMVAMAPSQLSPDANVANQLGGAAFTVYVWRFGGFNDEITLTGENLPKGVSIQPQVITGSQKVANVVVNANADAKSWTGAITIVGTANVKGQKLVREMRAASISWPVAAANTPTITRLDRELVLAVREQAPYTLAVGTQKLTVQQGEKIAIPVKLVPSALFKGSVTVVALGGPPGVTSPPITLTPAQLGGTATLELGKGGMGFVPGNYTVFLRGATQPINPKNPPKGPQPPNIQTVSMPISLTIVPKQLGKVTATPAMTKLAPGKEVEITARVARQFDFPSSFKVEAIFPPTAKGLSAKDVSIATDADEAKLIIRAAPDAAVAANTSVTIRFTSMFNETVPIVHEAKLTISLAK